MAKGSYFLVFSLASSLAMACCLATTMQDAKEHVNLAAENAEATTEEMKHKTTETVEKVKENTESWTDWARDKISEGLGFRGRENVKETAQQMMDEAGDAAARAKMKVSDVASGAAGVASEKVGEAREAVKSKVGVASEKVGEAGEVVKSKAGDVAGKMAEKKDEAKDAAGRTFEDAKERSGDARDTVTEHAKANYDATKEKAAELGEKVKNKFDEL